MKIKFNTSMALLLGASTIALSVGGIASAQESDEGADSRRLGTVTVTATQRAESIQDVPIAVTALDAESLERAGVADITNLPALSASFNMSNSQTESGGSTLRIRGVGTTGNNAGLESAVGVFLDGVYLSRPGVALADLVDLEQIEVLRGPQGTLFGRNTSAGALNIKTKAPDLNDVDSFANVTFGNYSAKNLQAGVSVPIIQDKLAVRVSAAIRDRGAFFQSTTGAESHTRDRQMIRAQALYAPTDDIKLRVIFDAAEGQDDCCDAVWVSPSALNPLFTLAGLPGTDGGAPAFGQSAIDGYDTNADQYANPFEQVGLSAQLDWDLGAANLTYLGAIRGYQSSSSTDTDFTNYDVFAVGPELIGMPNGQKLELQTHELRLQGNAFDDRLDWLVGLYTSKEDIDSTGSLALGPDYQAYAGARFLAVPGVFAGFGPNPLRVFAGGVDANGSFATNKFTQAGDSFSVFTHNVFDVTDKMNVTVGLRWVDETKDGKFEQIQASSNACNAVLANAVGGAIPAPFINGAFGLTCFPFSTVADHPLSAVFPTPRTFDQSFADDELVYTVKAGYNFTPDISGYAGLTHGFKSGGFNLDPTAAVVTNTAAVLGGAAPEFADPRFRSETIDAYEIGLKSDFWDGRARLNIAAFYQEMEDFQVLEFTGIRFQTFNVPKAESTGVEIEGQFLVTDNLTLMPALTWTDAKYPSDCDNGNTSNANASNLCGAALTNAPEWVAILGANYEQRINESGVMGFISASARYEDDRRTSTQPTAVGSNVPLFGDIQEANTKVDLRLGATAPDGRWTVELWGKNITDEHTKTVTFNIPLNVGARGAFFQDPATYGVTLRVRN